jgi:hypothetical protein
LIASAACAVSNKPSISVAQRHFPLRAGRLGLTGSRRV